MKKLYVTLLGYGILAGALAPCVLAAKIEGGKNVKFDYTLTVNEQVIETTEGGEPLAYVHGSATIIAGLEKELEGMEPGESKTITIAPEDAYGPVMQEAIKSVPKANFPPDFQFVVGSVIQLSDPQGKAYPGIIWEIKEDAVVVNFNHPLAGQTLIFEVTIVAVD
jgi:FKBP-type peptidyl-prolyl cis-trans isomerase 2